MRLKLLLIFIQSSLTASILYGQLNMTELGSLEYDVDASDIWGYVDEQGNEYAIMGLYNGTAVIDVTDPANPEEIYFVSGPQSIWRDIKTWGDYAYVSNETNEGILVIDLSPLPDNPITSTSNFTGSSFPFTTSHNIYIDEQGRLYIFGANYSLGGAIICDLTEDPMIPTELGVYDNTYFHDGMARGDTLWGGAIYTGELIGVDVSDPANPVILGSASTPGQFCHNIWISDDGKHVFTTDEVENGYIGAFNVEDMSNIFEVDRYQSSPGENVIPHNAHVLNDFIVTSYYTDGVVVVDGKFPDRLVEVANFDTSPSSGGGFFGNWGAYPYLPSGIILASDIEYGLFVLDIEYINASYLEGKVVDSIDNSDLFDVNVEILGTEYSTTTNFLGNYNFGFTLSGTFDVQFSKDEYNTKIVENIDIVNGEIVTQDVQLSSVNITSLQDIVVKNQLTVSPNPFYDQITIIWSDSHTKPVGQTELSLLNISGQEIFNLKSDLGEFNNINLPGNIPSGIYFLKLTHESGFVDTFRLLKN